MPRSRELISKPSELPGLAFFISCIMAWSIGPIEALEPLLRLNFPRESTREVISLVVFVGYSVTYALHIAHNYNQMREDDQDLRAAEAKARQRQKERSKAKLAAKAARERARDPDFEELGVEARCFLACRSLRRMGSSPKSQAQRTRKPSWHPRGPAALKTPCAVHPLKDLKRS